MTSRHVCFTSFNSDLRPTDIGDIRYIIYQVERCPKSDKLHLQGYLELSKPTRYSGIKKLLGDPTAHLEPRKGTRDQARDYCRKDESRVQGPFEYGTWISGQGKRTDLDDVADLLRESPKLDTLLDDHLSTFIKYPRGIKDACFLLNKRKAKLFRTLEVVVLWGEAGTGKTRRAVEDGEDYYILEKNGDSLWFDGYDGEKTLIIDDFYGWIPYNNLLRILDGYTYKCNVKGSFVYAAWTKVFITSNRPPHEWYDQSKLNDSMKEALTRRISEVIELNKEDIC